MFSRLSRTVLWKYADDAPITTLHRHHRLAARICMVGFGAGAVMVSSAVDLLISPEGWRRTVTLVMLGSATLISLLMTVPAIIAYAWANEVEKEITARGLPLPDGGRLQQWLPRTVMRMLFWFLMLVLVAWLFQHKSR